MGEALNADLRTLVGDVEQAILRVNRLSESCRTEADALRDSYGGLAMQAQQVGQTVTGQA